MAGKPQLVVRRGRGRAIVAAVAAAMIAAACGGGGSKKPSAGDGNAVAETTTTTTVETQAVASTTTSAPGTTSTTAPKVVAGTKATTKTTTRISVAPQQQKLTSGIQNVQAPATTAAPRSDIQAGGTLVLRKPGEIASLDPLQLSNSGLNDGTTGTALYDVLVYTTSTDGSLAPQLATSLTSPDGLVWTLKLRPNVKFSDGTPYDAAAVKFNWERLQDPKNAAALAGQANSIQSMSASDAQTLVITLKTKSALFPLAVAQMSFVGSPAAIQQKGDGFRTSPVGAGAFLFKSWQQGATLTLVRNPNYWNAPRPYLDQLIMRSISDENQAVSSFKTGEVQLVGTLAASSADQIAKAAGVPHTVVINGGPNIFFNVSKAPFNDIRVRQAFVQAIDLKEYDRVLQAGLLDPLDSIFRPSSLFYDKSILQLPYDATKAQSTFDAVAAATGGPVTFDISTFESGGYDVIGEYFQGVLNKYRNVKVTLSKASVPAHLADTYAGNYQASVFGNPFVDIDPVFTSRYTCDANPQVTRWCNTEFDNLVNDQRITLDQNKRIADIKQMQRILYQEAPTMYFDRRVIFYMSTAAVQDVDWINDGAVLYDRVWLKS